MEWVIVTPSKIKDQGVFSREKLTNRDCRIVMEELENLIMYTVLSVQKNRAG